MIKQQVEQKIKAMLSKHKAFKNADIKIIFKDKGNKKNAKYSSKSKRKI